MRHRCPNCRTTWRCHQCLYSNGCVEHMIARCPSCSFQWRMSYKTLQAQTLEYRGWSVWYDRDFYVYRARQVGVTMNHTDPGALGRMIDRKIEERRKPMI